MSKTVWGEARVQAWRDTLELARLNDPFRAAITLGVPLVTLAGVWLISHQLALAAVIGLLALFTLAFVAFLTKFFGNLARIAEHARSELVARSNEDDRAERERRVAMIGRLVRFYLLEMGDDVSPAIKAALELPPEDWLNNQLARRGEQWQIFDVHGTAYSTFEVVPGEWRYKGQRMGSAPAIRWAAFFDALKLKWEPAEEHWNHEHGAPPDFWLPELKVWFVAESLSSGAKDASYQELSRNTHMRVIVATGEPAWADENLRLFEEDGAWDVGGMAWGEDRRDEGIYWLTKNDGSAAVCIGGPGRQTDHDRGPLVTNRLKSAVNSAREQKIEVERPVAAQ